MTKKRIRTKRPISVTAHESPRPNSEEYNRFDRQQRHETRISWGTFSGRPGGVLAGGDREQIILRQELSEAIVVRDERGHDADCATCLAHALIAGKVGCSHTHETKWLAPITHTI